MSDKVVSLNGGRVVQRERNETCIKSLREMLEAAESGEIVGVAVSILHCDKSSSYRIAGLNGGYAMIGGLECAKAVLVDDANGEG